ncbi:DNA polymerase V family protein [Haloarcula sp. S1CR25-12]|uniref:DNA polymerase V family protein n=1 Tax=Haloarcula saliterrae TaxID=2950534 RepID=A0ABU2FBB2_9EURY|nr:hypothetical protein [Haloarcula sp. S1CR25-12]MDS0259111.1 DNA polymerase V family protein [Haloarcula sp. S1CR25-12]
MTATAAVLGGIGLAATTDADDRERSFVAEQDGECLPVVPLTGDVPVEEFYDWGREERSWSSEGTGELQRSETSLLFLYRGPDGLSLVLIHDRADDGTPGGAASVTVEGVPDGATWVVKDDLYDAPTNVDRWELDGTVVEANETEDGDIEAVPVDDQDSTDDEESTDEGTPMDDEESTDEGTPMDDEESTEDEGTPADGEEATDDADERTDEIDWWWTEGRTDGGALRGLAMDDLALEIEMAFNEAAALYEDPDHGEITTWTLLSGDTDDPERTELDPEETLTLRTGSYDGGECEPAATEDADSEPETAEEEATATETDDETTEKETERVATDTDGD